MNSKYEPHELASIFPEMGEEEYQALESDIATNGQLEPITLYEDRILDGRHRYRACQELGIEPTLREYEGTNPEGYVLSLNLHRRHLSGAALWGVILRMLDAEKKAAAARSGQRTDLRAKSPAGSEFGRTRDRVAAGVGCPITLVRHVQTLKKTCPGIVERVVSGDVTPEEALGLLTPDGLLKPDPILEFFGLPRDFFLQEPGRSLLAEQKAKPFSPEEIDRFVRLAHIPHDLFEVALADPECRTGDDVQDEERMILKYARPELVGGD
jgi:hypothetical protein